MAQQVRDLLHRRAGIDHPTGNTVAEHMRPANAIRQSRQFGVTPDDLLDVLRRERSARRRLMLNKQGHRTLRDVRASATHVGSDGRGQSLGHRNGGKLSLL